MTEYGLERSRSAGREFLVTNSGHRHVESVQVGGHKIELGTSGAVIYDETLANEVKAKHALDPNVKVIEKDYIRGKDGPIHRWVFSVQKPVLPDSDDSNWVEVSPGNWKRKV